VLGRQGKFEDSFRVIKPVVEELEAAGADDALAQDLARAYASIGTTADKLHLPESITWHEKAAEAARRAGDPLLEAQAFMNAGAYWIGEKQFRRAEQNLVRARSVFEELNERSALTGVEINLGNLCRDERRWSEAEAHYERAHALSQATGNRWQQGYVFINRGTMMKERERNAEARSLLLEARKIFEDLGSAVLLGRCDEYLAGLTGPGTR
jgi:tetratricopeptide (TPR) repeat protein